MMTFLLIVFVTVLVLVVFAAWVAIRALELTFKGIAWTARGLVGGNAKRERHGGRAAERCDNDGCSAMWRDGARFCHRCGQPRRALVGGPRPSRELTRVA